MQERSSRDEPEHEADVWRRGGHAELVYEGLAEVGGGGEGPLDQPATRDGSELCRHSELESPSGELVEGVDTGETESGAVQVEPGEQFGRSRAAITIAEIEAHARVLYRKLDAQSDRLHFCTQVLAFALIFLYLCWTGQTASFPCTTVIDYRNRFFIRLTLRIEF